MIDESIVKNIIETANEKILEVVSDFVPLSMKRHNDDDDEKKGRKKKEPITQYIGCCPFHKDNTSSFIVTPIYGIYNCLSCGKSGNAVNFVMEYEHLTFEGAIKYLGEKFGIAIPSNDNGAPAAELPNGEYENMSSVVDFACKTFQKNLFETEEGQSIALPYFKQKREFSDETIKTFQLGYSLEKSDAFTVQALANGYKLEYLEKTGLTIVSQERGYQSDRFRGRVMFPIHSITGKVIAFGGRVMQERENVGKYLNSPESELYHKSDVVYGIYQAKDEMRSKNHCFLVEGYADVISMHQAGIKNVIASSGTSLTDGHIALIKRFTNNITLLFDGDKAGIKAAMRGIDKALSNGMNVKVLLLAPDDGSNVKVDPDSFVRSHSLDEVLEYIKTHETDFIKFKASFLVKETQRDPLRRSEAIKDIINTIALVQDKVTRDAYVRECASIMQMSEQTLFDVLRDKLIADSLKRRDEIEKSQHQTRFQEYSPAAEYEAYVDPNSPTAITATPTATAATKNTQPKNPYANEEQMLLRFFVKYVNKLIFVGTENESTLGEYVIKALASENYESVDSNFNKMIQCYIDAEDKTTVKPQTFINTTDIELSQKAAALMQDKYELSKIHNKYSEVVPEEEMVDELIFRVIGELRMKLLLNKIKDLTTKMQTLELQGANNESLNNVLEEINYWNTVKRELSKIMGGERAVSNI
ncbi:MAG: DNA primase [Bacteroidales bacterium]|jgi:DNA primase|nr:DNA primase [Bacteroidales bacterium]